MKKNFKATKNTVQFVIQRLNLFGDEDNDVQMDELMKTARENEHRETEEDKLLRAPIDLVRQGLESYCSTTMLTAPSLDHFIAVKISMMMSGKNVSNFDKKNFKMISPRFLPVVPEEDTDNEMVDKCIFMWSGIVSKTS